MDSSLTDLYLPNSFPFPIKIISLDTPQAAAVIRGTRLLSYSFVHYPPVPGAQPETRFGTWDAAIEGTLDSWKVKVGDVISQRKAKDRAVVVINEPCKHGMQVGGLCVLCGKDMTNTDYTGFSDASRASIQMTHSAFGPTVSLEEAQRIERETAEHLLKSRKLSLIVDLDQTIVHATVDPTVGEWIAEGEAWEEKRARKANKPLEDDDDDSDDSSSDDEDECNPNWEALKDVKKFRLGPESFAPPSAQKAKGKNRAIENEGCMYYIKPRPGWKEFLRETAAKYEMHVYTMGTRAYAEEVCAAIDPDGSIFGGRLLSRDESGSLTQKSLQRLFPCDTSMVVIIDDRADVWEWSPNLIKVVPYDFFVGIGDINSTFLPKIEQTPLSNQVQPSGSTPALPPEANGGSSTTTPHTPLDPTPLSSETPEAEQAELIAKTMLKQNNAALEAQLEERPLAKKQEELIEGASHAQLQTQSAEEKTPDNANEKDESASIAESAPEKVARKALLKNDDYELERVGKLLDEVHTRFFASYEARSPESSGSKRKPKSPKPYDVTRIIPRLRSEVLQGIHILFSSVIPLDTLPDTTEVWRMAHMFGARCSTELTSDITHVVAAKRGTVKVDMARKRGGIKIVWLSWFSDSVATWQRQEETPYFLDEPSTSTSTLPSPSQDQQVSSDPDIDEDDWDEEIEGNPRDPSALELEAINWDDINDEVDAAMNESDDDDDDMKSERSVMSGDEDWEDALDPVSSVQSTPRLKRKRLRSVTPSDIGRSTSRLRDDVSDDGLRSPLAKRKKLAAERTGYSKLKEGVTASELVEEHSSQESNKSATSGNGDARIDHENGDDEDEDDADEDDEDDDFLARELEDELG